MVVSPIKDYRLNLGLVNMINLTPTSLRSVSPFPYGKGDRGLGLLSFSIRPVKLARSQEQQHAQQGEAQPADNALGERTDDRVRRAL